MQKDLAYRAALLDAFVAHLKRLSPDELRRIEGLATPFGIFYQSALELATMASQYAAPMQAGAYDAMLRERFDSIDALIAGSGSSRAPTPGSGSVKLRAMAKAAARALSVRDTPPFTAAAFEELYGPFRGFLDLSALEREAALAAARARAGPVR